MVAQLLSEPRTPAAGEAPVIALPFRLHAEVVEEMLEQLPPLVLPPRFEARHVRAVEPGALLALTMLAASLGVLPPCSTRWKGTPSRSGWRGGDGRRRTRAGSRRW